MEKDTITYGYTDPDDDKKYLDETNAMKDKARMNAGFLAKQNRPALSETEILPFIGGIKTESEERRTRRLGIIKAEVHKAKFNRFVEDKIKREKLIDESIENLSHQNRLDERELNGKTRPEEKKRNLFVALALGIMYIGEFFLNILAFEFLGGSPFLAYGFAAAVTIISFILSYGVVWSIAKVETKGRKMYWLTGLLLAASLMLVVCMSSIRTRALADSQMSVSPMTFFGIYFAFCVGAIIFSKMFFPSQKETDADTELRKRFEKIDGRENEIKQLIAEKEQLAKQHAREETEFLFIMSQATNTCKRIEADYREAVELFKTENLITRPDGGTPECFKLPTPDLRPLTPNNQ